MGNVQEKWEAFLNPDAMRPALIMASLYITGFELLKDTIVDRPKGFFTNGFGPDGLHLDPAYQADVLSKNKSVLYASLEWLKGMGTIDDSDPCHVRAREGRSEHDSTPDSQAPY